MADIGTIGCYTVIVPLGAFCAQKHETAQQSVNNARFTAPRFRLAALQLRTERG